MKDASDASYSPWTVETRGAHAVNRAALLMRILAISGAKGMTLGEIAELAQLPKATVHRLLAALVDEKLAERATHSRRYRLGMEVLALGAAAGPRHDLRKLAQRALEAIAFDTGHAMHLMIRSGYDAVCLDQVIPGAPTSMIGKPGARAPLGVGCNSLALLSSLADDEIAEVMERNRPRLLGHPVFGPEAILAGIRQVRRRGYCVMGIERNPRVFGVGVAILASNRRPLAAFGITTLDGLPLAPAAIETIADRLQRDAARLARDYEAVHEETEQAWIDAGR